MALKEWNVEQILSKLGEHIAYQDHPDHLILRGCNSRKKSASTTDMIGQIRHGMQDPPVPSTVLAIVEKERALTC